MTNSFAEDVSLGLTADKKYLLPKYFYDSSGSELFEKICTTKEYYLTRTEIDILKSLSDTISERNRNCSLIVEPGSGSSFKTNYLLNSFMKIRSKLHYVPIDVSEILIESSKLLIDKYSKLSITGIISLYQEGMDFLVSMDTSPKVILFLGSSIGNFSEDERISFIKMLRNDMSKDDRLLIGFDMVKDRKVLEDAYNDSKGFTALFNLNILKRINRELGGNFIVENFKHHAFFNEEKSRVEMHLISQNYSEALINDALILKFRKGETIHTENSYKFTKEMINELAEQSEMEFSDFYTDEREYFSLCTFKLK